MYASKSRGQACSGRIRFGMLLDGLCGDRTEAIHLDDAPYLRFRIQTCAALMRLRRFAAHLTFRGDAKLDSDAFPCVFACIHQPFRSRAIA